MLFHFIHLESEKGILIAPAKNLELQANNILYSYIVKTFRIACKKIHELLQHSIRYIYLNCMMSINIDIKLIFFVLVMLIHTCGILRYLFFIEMLKIVIFIS